MIEIEIVPLETERLTTAKTRAQHGEEQARQTVVVHRLDQLAHLLGRQRPPLAPCRPRRTTQRRSVPAHHLPPLGLRERLGEHGTDPADGGDGQTTIELRRQERIDFSRLQFRDLLLSEGRTYVNLGDALIVGQRRGYDLMAHHVLEPPIEEPVDRDVVVIDRMPCIDLAPHLAEFFQNLRRGLGRDRLAYPPVVIPTERDRTDPLPIARPLINGAFAVLSGPCHRRHLL